MDRKLFLRLVAAAILLIIHAPFAHAQSGTLIFTSGFESSTTISAPQDCWSTPSVGCWAVLSGTDNTTGYSWGAPLWGSQYTYGGGSVALLIADVPGATPAEIGDYLSDRIVTTRRHNGDWNNQAFYSENSSAKNGQNPKEYSVTQEEVNFFPMSEPGDLYMSYWIRFQPGMIENMLGLDTSQVGATTNGGTWRSFFAFKTGTNASAGSAPLDNGDYRVEAYVLTGCSYDQITAQIPPCTGSNPNPAPFWMVNGDNVAGGSYALVNNWSELNSAIPVPDDGSWNKFEVFWHRSSGSDGRFWMAINGAQLVNHIGPNMGQASMSINRIMPELLYTGGHYPIYQWIDDIQIWDGGFPPSTCTPGVEYWCDPPYASH